jgi:hypothetical protein
MDHNLELTQILRTGERVEIRGTSSGFSVRVDGSHLDDVETMGQAIELLQEFTVGRDGSPVASASPLHWED